MIQIPPKYQKILGKDTEQLMREHLRTGIDLRILIGEFWGLFSRSEATKLTNIQLSFVLVRAAKQLSKRKDVAKVSSHIRYLANIKAAAAEHHTTEPSREPAPLATPPKKTAVASEKRKQKRKPAGLAPPDQESENDVYAYGRRLSGSYQSKT